MGTLAFDGSQSGTPVGCYSYTVADGRWTWSDEVYHLHGFAPREVPATTDVLLLHKHPDDRTRTFEVMEAALEDGEPFACYHRIIDRHEQVRFVLSVGRGVRDGQGNVTGLEGFFVDLTSTRLNETQAEVEIALARIAEHRAVIEQAKGIVMLAGGCGADDAFRLLSRCSQNANLKLHDVAHRLVDAAGGRLRSGDQVVAFLKELGLQKASRASKSSEPGAA